MRLARRALMIRMLSPSSRLLTGSSRSPFNVGKGIGHIFQTEEIYKMWEDLLPITDAKARDAQLRKRGARDAPPTPLR